MINYLVIILLVLSYGCATPISRPMFDTATPSTKYADFDIFNMVPVGRLSEKNDDREQYVVVSYDSSNKIKCVEISDLANQRNLVFEPKYDSARDCYLWQHCDPQELGEPIEYFIYIKNGVMYDYEFYGYDSTMFLERISVTTAVQTETWTAKFPYEIRMPKEVHWDYCNMVNKDSLLHQVKYFEFAGNHFTIRNNNDTTAAERYQLPYGSFIWYMYLGMYYGE